jgi:hypothetical protein
LNLIKIKSVTESQMEKLLIPIIIVFLASCSNDDPIGNTPTVDPNANGLLWKEFIGTNEGGARGFLKREKLVNIISLEEEASDGKDIVLIVPLLPFYEDPNGVPFEPHDFEAYFDMHVADDGAAIEAAAFELGSEIVKIEEAHGIEIFVQAGNEINGSAGGFEKYELICNPFGTTNQGKECMIEPYVKYILLPLAKGIKSAGAKMMTGSVINTARIENRDFIDKILDFELDNGSYMSEYIDYSSGHYMGALSSGYDDLLAPVWSNRITGHIQTEEVGAKAAIENYGASQFLIVLARTLSYAIENDISAKELRFCAWGSNLGSEGSTSLDMIEFLDDEILGDNRVELTTFEHSFSGEINAFTANESKVFIADATNDLDTLKIVDPKCEIKHVEAYHIDTKGINRLETEVNENKVTLDQAIFLGECVLIKVVCQEP